MKTHDIILLIFCSIFANGQKYDAASIAAFQTELNAEFADPLKSPLSEPDRISFQGLAFYPADSMYFVIAKFARSKNEKPFEMKTSTARKPMYVRYGTLDISLGGKSFRLNVYQDVELTKKTGYHNHLFLPFSDLTCGNESYIGGRYIDLKIPDGTTIAVDFNKAYNPYCAYNHKYSCPAVPLENDLNIEIKAGVKSFHN